MDGTELGGWYVRILVWVMMRNKFSCVDPVSDGRVMAVVSGSSTTEETTRCCWGSMCSGECQWIQVVITAASGRGCAGNLDSGLGGSEVGCNVWILSEVIESRKLSFYCGI
jgi:hypothetical protein